MISCTIKRFLCLNWDFALKILKFLLSKPSIELVFTISQSILYCIVKSSSYFMKNCQALSRVSALTI